MNARFINCEDCQTEGRILTNDGGPDDVDHGPCPTCNGERVVEIETEPCGPFSECPSCKQMFENGGQCAAPVMARRLPNGRGCLMDTTAHSSTVRAPSEIVEGSQ